MVILKSVNCCLITQGLTRLSFSPYTFEQLEKIIRSRLEDLKLFEADAIKLAVRKVSTV